MAFNALISNLDDHPRNHAVIALNQYWRLSPAYDLTPARAASIERRDLAMTCGDQGRYANAENLLSQCERFLVSRGDAAGILDEMEAAVRASWYEVARREGVSEADCRSIAGAFAYEGFRLKPDPVH
jgi:serine/threonine-protein kinase HipA